MGVSSLLRPKKGEKIGGFSSQCCQELVKVALGRPEIDVEIKSILPRELIVGVAEKF